MKLYLLHRCPFGHRASIVLREKKLDFEPVFFTANNRPPELNAVSPYAKSPTLFDGNTIVWDSQIVIEYLDEVYRDPPLMPSSSADRATMRMLTARVPAELGIHLGAAVVETRFKPQPDVEKLEAAKRGWIDALGKWDDLLKGRAYLMGDQMTLADVTLFTPFTAMHGLTGVGVPPEREHLTAWLDRMAARGTTELLAPS